MLSLKLWPGHWFARVSATIYLQPRRFGGPPINRYWLLFTFNGRSYLRDQQNACWIDDINSCCCLLGTMILTSSAPNKWLQASLSAKSLINIRKRRGQTPLFAVHSHERWSSNFILNILFFRNVGQESTRLPHLIRNTFILTARSSSGVTRTLGQWCYPPTRNGGPSWY